VPGVADLLEARLGSYFEPESPRARAALRALAAAALYGGGLYADLLLRAVGDDEDTRAALEIPADAGMLPVSRGRRRSGVAQEMVRQAALNLVRRRAWLPRLHRSLLDVIAASPEAEPEAAFLAAGYDKLGALEPARTWLGRAIAGAIGAGQFAEA